MFTPALKYVKKVLCIGAHPDDIEIGCGGTLLRLIRENADIQVHWVVFSSEGVRKNEALSGADKFLEGAREANVELHQFNDRYFPAAWGDIKQVFERLGENISADVVFTHRRDDAHQDHRVLAELTWCAFRDHWILEYEIPKYEGDLGNPNVLVALDEDVIHSKAKHIVSCFPSQQTKQWMSAESILALARIRGIEADDAASFAEGFYCRKLVL